MKKKYILIGHKKKQGKDTFAKMLKEHLGDAEIFSFADPMREIFAQMLGTTVEKLKEAYNKDEDLRDALKALGNGKMIEYFGEQVWRDILIKRAEASDAEYIIMPDFRFLREHIKGATTINVVRDNNTTDTHQSETELDDYDYDIRVLNDSSLESLHKSALEICGYITAKEKTLSHAFDTYSYALGGFMDIFKNMANQPDNGYARGGFINEHDAMLDRSDLDEFLKEGDESYENLLKDDEHQENIDKLHHGDKLICNVFIDGEFVGKVKLN